MSVLNERIRYEILEILYANRPEGLFDSGHVGRDRLLESLPYPNREIEININNLEAKNLLKFHYGIFDDEWSFLSITEQGIEHFELMDSEDLPKSQETTTPQNIHIHGDVIGSVSQTQKGDISNVNYIIDTFNKARDYIKNSKDLDDEEIEEVIESIDTLEGEVQSDEPDEVTIRDHWDWLKDIVPQVVISLLTKIIIEALTRVI